MKKWRVAMSKVRTYLEVAGNDEYVITWFINNICNFKCEYCFSIRAHTSDPTVESPKYPPQHIAQAFDKTGKKMRIYISGGEPFLYPRFIELCVLLTKNHRISINTNLSTSNIYEFSESIDPSRVYGIHASLHILEREKISNGIEQFLHGVKHLQNKGFSVRVEYVTYPPLFTRIKKDIQFLTEQGVKTVNVKVFRGRFAGKSYPDSYNAEERSLIEELAIDQREINILSTKNSFLGNICSAGQRYFRMDEKGNLFRCNSSKKSYGNLFEGNYIFDEKPKLCPCEICKCPYEGMMFVVEKGVNKFLVPVVRPMLRLMWKTKKAITVRS